MPTYCFTVDDNIRFLKELNEVEYESIFDHPYLGMYYRLYKKYGLKIRLNLFYETEGFDLSKMTDRYYKEFRDNSNWLKLAFHSRIENVCPYEASGYDEVYRDCRAVTDEIIRFASPDALAKTATVHYCRATDEGLQALKDCGVKGLLGLYGTDASPTVSYQNTAAECAAIRRGEVVYSNGIAFGGIDVVLNCYQKNENLERISAILGREFISIMIHEQYFYSDYKAYQCDFEEKLDAAFALLQENGYTPAFFSEII